MKQIAVLGLSRFGASVARSLETMGVEVMGVDSDKEKVADLAHDITHVVQADILDNDALDSLGLRNFDVVVLSVKDVEISSLATIALKDHGAARIVAQATGESHAKILERIGAEVVHPEMETATRLAAVLLESAALDMMNLNDDYVVSEIKVNNWLNGKSVRDLHLEKYALKMIALERGSSSTIVNFSQEDIVAGGDAIAVIGKFSDVDRFERKVMNRE